MPEFRISTATHQQYRRTELEGGELLMTLVGDVGRAAIVPNSMRGWNAARAIAVMRFKDPQDAFYVRYCLQSAGVRHLMDVWSNTTVQQTLNLKEIRKLPLPWAPATERQRIVEILGTLDDKIELNRKTNETLEQMARALFKSWFVDFDPVRAKAAGRKPAGMDAETAKLFPSEFEESELGKIPKGWQVCKLGQMLELKRGYDLPSAQRAPGMVPIISSSGPSGVHSESRVRGPGVVTGRYGTIGRVFLIRGAFWPLNTTLYVRDFKGTDVLFAYHLLSELDYRKFSDKAAVPGINRNHVHDEPVVQPPDPLQARFAQITGAWLEQIAKAEEQGKALTELRDTLLPRLLSGEITVVQNERASELTA